MILVIVPCGRSKIWKKDSHLGSIPAREAYTGAPFKVNREYAETVGDRWVILSARYGFIEPTTLIANYEVTFKKANTNPVSVSTPRKQVSDLGLLEYDQVIALGGKEYRSCGEGVCRICREAHIPLLGIDIGKSYARCETKPCSEVSALAPRTHPLCRSDARRGKFPLAGTRSQCT